MILIIGFTSPPTIHFEFITKLDECITKCDSLLLQSATGITKCEKFITKCDRYYNVRQNTAVRNERYSRKKNNLRILCLEEHTGENLEAILFRPKL